MQGIAIFSLAILAIGASSGSPVEPAFDPHADFRYLLYTRLNPTVPQVLSYGDVIGILTSNFNPAHHTRFTFHGNIGGPQNDVNVLTTAAYLAIGEYNVNCK